MDYDTFTDEWYSIFLHSIDNKHSQKEVDFVQRHIPLKSHSTLLDIACGPGRHAKPLAQGGYAVIGIDKNAQSIDQACRSKCDGATFHLLDMRELLSLRKTFDGAINLWQSFGYYDETTNLQIMRDLCRILRPGGRAIFDIYNRDHMKTLPLTEQAERSGQNIRTTRSWSGDRMRCEIHYESGRRDIFEWQLYTPNEFVALAAKAGFNTTIQCVWFDETIEPSPKDARMQFVLEKPALGELRI